MSEKFPVLRENMEKYVKTQGKTQNSWWKLKKSALLGSLGAGKASKKKPALATIMALNKTK